MRKTINRHVLKALGPITVQVRLVAEGCDGQFVPTNRTKIRKAVNELLADNGIAVEPGDAFPRLTFEVRYRLTSGAAGVPVMGVAKIEAALVEAVTLKRNGMQTEVETWRHKTVGGIFAGDANPADLIGLVQGEIEAQAEQFAADFQAQREATRGVLEEKCADWDTLRDGEFLYENNVWNKAALQPGETYRQCVRRRSVGGRPQFGWAWSWPDRIERRVYAYPQVIFGKKPWSDAPTTTPKLPAAIARLGQVTLTYEVESTVEAGAYNLAPEVWIAKTGTNPTKADVASELMFWMDYSGVEPAGAKVEQITVDGKQYEVWYADMGAAPGPVWKYVTFRALVREPSRATLRIDQFLNYAIGKGYVDRTHFLASIELGNEISSGRGHTWVKQLSVTIP